MANDRHKNFIDGLVENHGPVKPLMTAGKRTILAFMAYPLIIAAIMLYIHPFRANFLGAFSNILFVIEMLAGAFSISYFMLFSFTSVIPGSYNKKSIFIALGSFLILALLIVKGIYFPHKAASMAGKRPSCYYEVLTLGIIPFLHLIYLCNKGVMFFKFRTLMGAAFASAAIPSILMHIACMYDPFHILDHHILPVIIFTAVASILSYIVVKRRI